MKMRLFLRLSNQNEQEHLKKYEHPAFDKECQWCLFLSEDFSV